MNTIARLGSRLTRGVHDAGLRRRLRTMSDRQVADLGLRRDLLDDRSRRARFGAVLLALLGEPARG